MKRELRELVEAASALAKRQAEFEVAEENFDGATPAYGLSWERERVESAEKAFERAFIDAVRMAIREDVKERAKEHDDE